MWRDILKLSMVNLAIIPARKGSKGLLGKNRSSLSGKPLFVWTILAAQYSGCFDDIVFTSDSKNYRDIARPYAVRTYLRSPKLATDDIPLTPVLINALKRYEYKTNQTVDTITCLQPTSPLRTAGHIAMAFKTFQDTKADSLISVCEERHSLWHFENGEFKAIRKTQVNRQLMEPFYVGNGAITITKREFLLAGDRFGGKVVPFVMDPPSSLDIHTKEDLEMAQWLMKVK